ncbi:MAG: hypothetical protein NTW78_11760 [Campylobacterales bacterium]|nr:hypothetical protein [Campylobacterales bacterium]
MIHTHSHTFKFNTQDTAYDNKSFNNIISIVEEDNKKHHIIYLQYRQIDEHNIHSRQISINLDRLYFLEVANAAIDDEERRKRLFTVVGKRCFGLNDNKIDLYLIDTINIENIKHNLTRSIEQPIYHELITHNTNRYEANTFAFEDKYFVTIKQTNISSRKTFEKTFLVQLMQSEHEKLLRFRTNELKVEFIFNVIGKIYFMSKPLTANYFPQQCIEPETIIKKAFDTLENSILTNSTFLNETTYKNLRHLHKDLEIHYFNIISEGMTLLKNPSDVETSYHLADAFSKFTNLLEKEKLFSEIASFLKTIQIFIRDGKISYLLNKNDNDIRDISLFLLETLTLFNASIEEDDLQNFSACSLDFYNALRYYIQSYLKFYSEHKFSDALEAVYEQKEEKKEYISNYTVCNKTSAREFLEDIGLDYSVLDELAELEDDIKNALYKERIDEEARQTAILFLENYSRTLSTFYAFKELSYSISILTLSLMNYELEQESNSMLIIFLNKVVDDLIDWKNAVFIRGDAEDINYIDNSFYANVTQINILINDNECSETEMEFF